MPAALAGSVAAFDWPPLDPVLREDLVAVVDFLGFAELVPSVAAGTELLA